VTDPRELDAVRWHILGWGAAISLGAFFAFGPGALAGAATGAALSVLNWLVLRAIIRKSLDCQSPAKLVLMLVLKGAALLAAAAAAVLMLPINAPALAFGVSSLFLGLATFGLQRSMRARSDPEQGS
jgi:hypothetical protein